MAKQSLKVALVYLLGVFCFFQLWTLNAPVLSGDEAIFGVNAADLLRELHLGHLPGLNPILPYIGPQDVWIDAVVLGLSRNFTSLSPLPWMLRLGPLLLYWIGVVAMARELCQRSERIAWIWTSLALVTPMAIIGARFGSNGAWGLGIFNLLWAESLRARRTFQARWGRIATLCGIALDCHPTYAIGAMTVLMTLYRELWDDLMRPKRRGFLLACTFLGLGLAYPVLRNLPPPVGSSALAGTQFIWELKALFNIVSGDRPTHAMFGRSLGPAALLITAGLAWIALFLWRWTYALWRSSIELDTYCTLIGSAFIICFCYRGRSLAVEGDERYLLSFVPAWIWLASEAIGTLGRKLKLSSLRLYGGLIGWIFLESSLLLVVEIPSAMKWDPYRSASEWLRQNCPREQCLAYAENFWSYWPIRFYSGDRIDVNVSDYNWKTVTPYPRGERELAGCWFSGSSHMYRGPYLKRVEFAYKDQTPGQVCFLGVKPAGTEPQQN